MVNLSVIASKLFTLSDDAEKLGAKAASKIGSKVVPKTTIKSTISSIEKAVTKQNVKSFAKVAVGTAIGGTFLAKLIGSGGNVQNALSGTVADASGTVKTTGGSIIKGLLGIDPETNLTEEYGSYAYSTSAVCTCISIICCFMVFLFKLL